jgi:hypothetical protein
MFYAILESVHCRRTSRIMKETHFPDKIPAETEISCMDNRFYFWHPIERIADITSWLGNSETVSQTSLERGNMAFSQAIKAVKSRGFNIISIDITIPEVKKAGFEVRKVIVPEFHPLYLDERAKSLYSKHYGEIPDNKWIKPHPLT